VSPPPPDLSPGPDPQSGLARQVGSAGSRLPADERRAQLLEAALGLFAQHGYHATSVSAVAAAAGVTKPIVYRHFPSKHALFRAVLRHLGDGLRAAVIEATSAAAGPRQQVEAGFRAYFGWVAGTPGGFDVLFAGEARRDPELLAEVAAVERDVAEAIAALIAVEGLGAGRRLLLAHGIVGLAEASCRQWLAAGPAVGADELAAQVAALAWAGLRSLHPS
jgi:AcrR family transcriptional regulator